MSDEVVENEDEDEGMMDDGEGDEDDNGVIDSE